MSMENIILKNEMLELQVSPRGAEMQSLITSGNHQQHLWHGDEAIWADRAPWLFPVIGQLKGGRYRYAGREYEMPMHGFASGADFEVTELGSDAAVFRLESNAETLKQFPWRFALDVAYRLNGGTVEITCRVRCLDEQEMFFSFGAHPGFVCAPGDVLRFEQKEKLSCARLCLETHLLRPERSPVDAAIVLDEALFDEDAMLFAEPAASAAVIERAEGSAVRFEFGRVPWVGVWSRKRKGLPYVCIEPWYGVDDPVDADGDIAHKPDIVRLPAGETFVMNMKITPFG